jgi:hypothetical protein
VIVALPRLLEVWPELAAQLEAGLRAQNDNNIADVIPTIRISGFCRCRGANCLTISSRSSPVRDAEHGSTVIDDLPGFVVIDIGRGNEITQVEILDWAEMRPSYLRMRRQVRWRPWKR